MDDRSRQMRYLILIAAVLCAVLVGYNAFYVPDASLSGPAVTVDPSSAGGSEEYTASSIPPASASSGVPTGAAFSSTPPSSRSSSAPVSRASSQAPAGKIDINTASAQQMSDGLPGIGDTIAQRIVAYREQHGPFKNIDGLKNVDGIGDKKFAAIRGAVTVG